MSNQDLSREVERLRQDVHEASQETVPGTRRLSGPLAAAVRWIAILFAAFHLYTAAFGQFPILIQRSLHVGGGLMLAFLLYAANKRKPSTAVAIWDWAAVAVAAVIPIWVALHYERWMADITSSTTMDLTLAVLTLVLVLEGARRVIGPFIPGLGLLLILYAVLGRVLPGPLAHAGLSWRLVLEDLFLTTGGLWGITTGITSTVVGIFIVFGAFLAVTGGGQTFMDLSLLLVGRYTGGPAKVAVISSALFGTISGSAAANVAVTGAFTIPMMRRIGYRPAFAAAVEATASSGGQIMPPIMGAGAFIMAELLGVGYLAVVKAAVVPALLFYFGVFVAVHLESIKNGLQGLPASAIPRGRDLLSLGRLAAFIVPVVVLLGLLFKGFTPMLAGSYATAAAALIYVLMGLTDGSLVQRLKGLLGCLKAGGYALIMISVLAASAQVVIRLLGSSGLGVRLSNFIVEGSGQHLFLALFLAMLVAVLLGMGVPTTAAYLLAAAVVVPALTRLDVPPMAAHLFVFYFAVLSAITPPVCPAAYVAAGMANTHWGPVAVFACRLGLVAFIVPYMFVFSPELLLVGNVGQVSLAIVTALVGTFCLAAGSFGYLWRPARWWESLLLLFAGGALVKPGLATDLIGLICILLAVASMFLIRRPSRAETGDTRCA